MKSKTIMTAIFATALLTSLAQNKQSSNECDSIKIENEKLKKLLNISPTIVKAPPFDDVIFTLNKVSGDKKSQFITVEVSLLNNGLNRDVEIITDNLRLTMFDGQVYFPKKVFIAGKESYGIFNTTAFLPNNVPTKCIFVYGPFLPSTKLFKHLAIPFNIIDPYNKNKKNGSVLEVTEIAIDWK
jgi:hypothetical protein